MSVCVCVPTGGNRKRLREVSPQNPSKVRSKEGRKARMKGKRTGEETETGEGYVTFGAPVPFH